MSAPHCFSFASQFFLQLTEEIATRSACDSSGLVAIASKVASLQFAVCMCVGQFVGGFPLQQYSGCICECNSLTPEDRTAIFCKPRTLMVLSANGMVQKALEGIDLQVSGCLRAYVFQCLQCLECLPCLHFSYSRVGPLDHGSVRPEKKSR